MLQSATDDEEATQPVDVENDQPEKSEEQPDIEEDLFEEELRIDGICGVY